MAAEKDPQKSQGGNDSGLSQGQLYGHQDKRVEVSCQLDRKPAGLGDGWEVGVDGDCGQFGRAIGLPRRG